MATMVKEKRKEKKKTKDSSRSKATREQTPIETEIPPISEEKPDDIQTTSTVKLSEQVSEESKVPENTSEIAKEPTEEPLNSVNTKNIEEETVLGVNIDSKDVIQSEIQFSELRSTISPEKLETSLREIKSSDDSYEIYNKSNISEFSILSKEDSYGELSRKLERMAIPNVIQTSEEKKEFEFSSPIAYMHQVDQESPSVVEDVAPSAPCFEEIPQSSPYQNVILEYKPKVKCMPIDDVMRLFSGGEMEDVRAMSEKEEENVEAGPASGPEHPLVDLLSTFRSSLMAVERERVVLANGFANEEKSRKSLWKIQKRHVQLAEKCSCGANVALKASYEHAELLKEKLPVAKMRLEGLLRDVQDSYCHHQHTALLAYYQIEELISETVKSNKPVIREALSLVLGALRLSASALEALTSALQRWAGALASALVDHRDLRQLLFILHHLFKQSRSVRWASRVLQVRVDIESPPRVLAVLELLLAKQRVDVAQECMEGLSDAEEVWEEVDKHGAGSAVSEGSLRERDLLALLHALPIRDLVARILLFTHNDIKQARPHEWVDHSGGRGLLRACYGVRALLQVLQHATTTHAGYARLKQELRHIASHALHGLAYLHLSTCHEYYASELKEKIYSELEASFAEGLKLFDSRDVHRLPANLLAEHTAKHYCLTHIEQLHEPAGLSCDKRVRIVSQAAEDRVFDHELARMVLGFLLETGLRRKPTQCKGSCDEIARRCVPRLLTAHPYLHTIAFHVLAEMNMVEALDVSCLKTLHVHLWRPSTGEVRAVLDDWARRCPLLLQHVLLLVDCTPHGGLPLDVQLSIGSWLCSHVRTTGDSRGVEWCWSAVRRLRTHRSSWCLPLDAPPPDEEPSDLFSVAFALLSSSWGHCIPVICSEGVSGLYQLADKRPRDAVHCLAGVMLVMAQSPESVALTPKFSEVLTRIVGWAPSLVARTLGRGGASGAELLLRLMLAQLEHTQIPSAGVLSVWLHALCRPALPVGALALADCGACCVRLWPQLDAYCHALLQEENANEHINRSVQNASTAPLLCECLLRASHTQHETLVHYGYGRLLNALHQQRVAGHKIHVDNALQKVSANISSEELVIYRVATAVLTAPMCHPSHLTLWRLLLHLYLQRAPDFMPERLIEKKSKDVTTLVPSDCILTILCHQWNSLGCHKGKLRGGRALHGDATILLGVVRCDSGGSGVGTTAHKAHSAKRRAFTTDATAAGWGMQLNNSYVVKQNGVKPRKKWYSNMRSSPPVGPLFFSGLIKSRTLGLIKKRLQKTITYHHNEAESLKMANIIESNQTQSTKSVKKSSPSLVDDNNMLPALTIMDLAGESCESSDFEDSEEESSREGSPSTSCGPKKNVASMVSYHVAAEKMLSEYLCWLEEGDKARACPQNADIARFIPEHALEEAWKRSVTRPVPSEDLDSFPLPVPQPPPVVTAPDTPFYKAVDAILKIKDRSRRRHNTAEITSPLEDVDFRDSRSLVTLVDKHLKDIEALAQEWCDEVDRISSLDSKLWELVTSLRVPRPIPSVRKQCSKGCTPIVFTIPAQEWCISVDTDRGIKENRNSARARIRRLARARPHAARTAAALHTIARRTRTSEAGVRVVERAWQCARARRCGDCAPVRTVLTALVTDLCERWICASGASCSQLLAAWGRRSSTPLQQALCGALLSPRRLPPADWPAVYIALLDAQLPSHTVFSYLSKFEMSRWSESADVTQRRDVLDALSRSIQRYGPTPTLEHLMLIELLGVHSVMVMTSQLLGTHVKDCVRASLLNKLPHSHWAHVVRAVDATATEVPFDQLGHLLRELGVMFWETRTGIKGKGQTAPLGAYAPYVARLLHALLRAFVAVATRLSYAPERVAWYSWSALQESWGAWISPHSGSLPLLPSTVEDEQYTRMLRHFVDSVHQIMLDCPGTEVYLLQNVFEWCTQTYVQASPGITPIMASMTPVPSMISPGVTQESRVQASTLLAELAKLPWREYQWFYGKSLQSTVGLQMCNYSDRELTLWVCNACRDTTADTLMLEVGDHIVPHLAMLLYLFTDNFLPFPQQFVDNACGVPWHRLPERALDEALEQFFRVHHNLAQPYHDVPQFRLILLACELAVPPGQSSARAGGPARAKRSLGVSQWVRAATAPALTSQVSSHTTSLLNTIALLESSLSNSEGELEELLSRAIVIMCIEPAASVALPVWVSWADEASPRMLSACVSAVTSLTAYEHFAVLSDAVTKRAMLSANSPAQWAALSRRYEQSPWRSAQQLASRARLHAAYASIITHEHEPDQILATLQTLLAADIQFTDNEPMVAVWICYSGRMAQQPQADLGSAARALLARWAEPERRSLLSRVMHSTSGQPTHKHRALCRYALWLLDLDHTSRRAFEAAFTSALTANVDVTAWTIAPQPNKLVTLAIRLYPKHDNYFQYELQLL